MHRAGAEHHLCAVGAHLAHIVTHQVIAALRHHRHVVVRPDRCRTQPDEAHSDLVGDLAHFAQMLVHFVAGLVDGFQRRAGKLQLAARLQRDIGAIQRQTNDLVAFQHRRPAIGVAQPLQNRLDRARAVIRQRLQRVFAITEFLVLGADAPVSDGLASRGEIFGHILGPFDRATARLRYRHDFGLRHLERWPQVATIASEVNAARTGWSRPNCSVSVTARSPPCVCPFLSTRPASVRS